jgi:hypothetical protein
MVPLRAFRKTMTVLAVAVACSVVASAMPEDPYQRWQLLDGTIHENARWIYERCRFDPTPIDVAFLGPSRMKAGVNAPQLSQALAARGLTSNVVNFSLPETGRNINLAIAEELFAYKQPKLLILGVIEKPSRFGHSAFKYVADRRLILDPGYLSDLDYLSDLIYLPFRQMRLFVANLLPGGLGLAKEFNPAHYKGPSIDTTGSVVLPDGRVKDGENPASAAERARGVAKLEADMHPPILPDSLASLEFGDERHNITQIADLARKHGSRVAFLFLPYYTGPSTLQGAQFYDQYGPTLNAAFLAPHSDWFADYGHLTRQGARILTDWLVEPVAALLKPVGASP